MKGFRVLLHPGFDHAGISTQSVVEKRLMKDQKLTRHDVGREEFLKKCYTWKDESVLQASLFIIKSSLSLSAGTK